MNPGLKIGGIFSYGVGVVSIEVFQEADLEGIRDDTRNDRTLEKVIH